MSTIGGGGGFVEAYLARQAQEHQIASDIADNIIKQHAAQLQARGLDLSERRDAADVTHNAGMLDVARRNATTNEKEVVARGEMAKAKAAADAADAADATTKRKSEIGAKVMSPGFEGMPAMQRKRAAHAALGEPYLPSDEAADRDALRPMVPGGSVGFGPQAQAGIFSAAGGAGDILASLLGGGQIGAGVSQFARAGALQFNQARVPVPATDEQVDSFQYPGDAIATAKAQREALEAQEARQEALDKHTKALHDIDLDRAKLGLDELKYRQSVKEHKDALEQKAKDYGLDLRAVAVSEGNLRLSRDRFTFDKQDQATKARRLMAKDAFETLMEPMRKEMSDYKKVAADLSLADGQISGIDERLKLLDPGTENKVEIVKLKERRIGLVEAKAKNARYISDHTAEYREALRYDSALKSFLGYEKILHGHNLPTGTGFGGLRRGEKGSKYKTHSINDLAKIGEGLLGGK